MSIRRAAAAACAVVAVFLACPGVALAHTFLVGSDPSDGSRLASSPGVARLQFDQPVSASLSRVELRGARSGRVSGVAVSASGSTLVATLPKLERDSYLLDWQAVSADDLHPSSGAITFAVGVAGVTSPTNGRRATATVVEDPSTKEVLVRWIDFGALAGLIGALTLALLCVPSARRRGASGVDELERRLLGIAVVSGIAALWTGVGLLLVQASAIGSPGEVLVGTHYGNAWIARELLLAALVAGGLLTAHRGRRPRQSAAIFVAAALLAFALAANSHSASARGVISVATGALALHVLSAAVWAGGLCALAICLTGRRRAVRDRGSALLVLRSFGGVAVLGVAALVITGIYTAGVDVASPEALVTTLYGRTLLVKTAVFVALALVGLSNALLVQTGRGQSRSLARGLRAEALLVLAILFPVAVLLSTAPARAPRLDPTRVAAAEGSVELRSLDAGDLIVSLSVKPNTPGVNFVSADVIDTRRPAPEPISSVDVAVARPGREATWRRSTHLAGSRWQLSDARLPDGGRWTVGLRIRRKSLPDQIVRTHWSVPTSQPRSSAGTGSASSLAPFTTWLAALAGAALAAVGLAITARRIRAREAGRRPSVNAA